MKFLSVEDKTAEFLITLAKRISKQDSHGTAEPYYYTVRCDREIAVHDGATGEVRYFDNNAACSYTEPELRTFCSENSYDVDEYVSEHCSKYDVDTIDVDENVFLTLDGYEEHMKLNEHNYRHYKDHRPYIQHAFRNPEMGSLIMAIKEIGNDLARSDAESCLHEICHALGWQGGTIHQVIDEIKRLRRRD